MRYIILLIGIYLYNYLTKIDNINSPNIQLKIKEAYDNNFGISLSLIPYFNRHNVDYLEFFKMIDFIDNREKDVDIYKKSKISIKIRQLSDNNENQQKILESIVKYANNKNVFVWISAVLPEDLENEFFTYLYLRSRGYNNVGITLATYHTSINTKVNTILTLGGNIRLVKGYYYGDIKNWTLVSELYYLNSKKLIESGTYHTLATHDFVILNKLHNEYNDKFNNIELAFFHSYLNYANKKSQSFNNNKSVYIPYGNKYLYLIDNFLKINKLMIVSRYIKNLFNLY